MQYYTFNINDYTGGTAHLDPIEDIAYRRLIDLYYQTEAPITADIRVLAKRLRLREHVEEIGAVLTEFFWFDEECQVWRNERCERELAELYAKSEKARQSAAARWSKQDKKKAAGSEKKDKTVSVETPETPENKGTNANAMRTHSERNANAMLPNTQDPILTINQSSARDEKISDDEISDGLTAADGFAMRLDWKPADENALALLLRNARLPAMGTELFDERLAEFVLHWIARPETVRTEAQWVHTLVQALLYAKNHGLLNPVAAAPVVNDSGRSVAPAAAPVGKGQSATAKSRDCLKVAKIAVLGGQAQTATPAPVFAAVVDGLMECLGHGLAYPPAADAWDLTLKTWDAAFAKLRLTADAESVQRVQTAFAVTLKAALKSDGRVFPKVDDVVANLPMRLVAKAIERKQTAEEKAAAESARAAIMESGSGIGKILKKRLTA